MLRHKCTEARNAAPHPWTGNNVNVKIVDHCSGCPSTIDLSREAFTQIANPVSGIINIDYHGPEAHTCNVVSKAEDHSSSSIRLQIDDMACQLSPGGYVITCT
ncbi:hypothetical protein CICLE_v10010417mg [Citrus x clementina]|uniref:RlpA-like protein double-psi beta-barrel domain-containing protein n=1 Tax=Citrus clementina TaxID=85681 RepID=V4UVL1_CITCL|nr:hypothetical protein CICLE_v10010417mg [Citrus x clementina]